MPPTLLDTRELAEVLGEDYGDVLTWAKTGAIPSITVGKRRVFNLKAVVDALKPRRPRFGYASEEPRPCATA